MADIELPRDEYGEEEEYEESPIEAALALLPANDGYIQVHTKDEHAGEMKYKGTMQPDGFSLEAVRERFGGGHRFVLDFYGKRERNGRMRTERLRRETVYVDKTPDEIAAERAAAAGGGGGGADTNAIVQAITESLRPTQELMIRMLERQSAPSPASDPGQMMEAVARTMQTLHGMTPAPAAPADTGGNLENLLGLLEAARDFTQGKDKSDPIEFLREAIKEFGGPLLRAAQQQSAAPQLPAATTTRPDSQGGATANEQEEHPLAPYVRYLMEAAAADKNPGNYVMLICDEVPAQVLDQILKDPVNSLAALDPRAKQYEAWITELAGLIVEERQLRAKEDSESQSGANESATNEGASG